jgi:hypothetical protein
MRFSQQRPRSPVTNRQHTPDLSHQGPVLRRSLLRRRSRTIQNRSSRSKHRHRLRLHRRHFRFRPPHHGKNIQRPISNPLHRIIIQLARTSACSTRTGRFTTRQRSHERSDSSLNRLLRLHHRRVLFHTSIIARGSDKTGRFERPMK